MYGIFPRLATLHYLASPESLQPLASRSMRLTLGVEISGLVSGELELRTGMFLFG